MPPDATPTDRAERLAAALAAQLRVGAGTAVAVLVADAGYREELYAALASLGATVIDGDDDAAAVLVTDHARTARLAAKQRARPVVVIGEPPRGALSYEALVIVGR